MADKWFHPRESVPSRERAEEVLTANGMAEGLFLVRESSTADGDFVLSVVHEGSVIHYQIRRRGEDALFSLSEEKKVIHGLDQVIYYYRRNPNTGLQHSLGDFVEGELCPNALRLHGSENLLHRATAEGNAIVVSELLNCGYRNLSAKNHDGQSAVHLASFYGHVKVLSLLIHHGASVNSTDSSGYSPLHFACQSDKSDVVEVLLDGGANPTARNQITGWVPLHEAAWKGHLECCKKLLERRAPCMSRTPKNETPSDLARANGFFDLAKSLDEQPPPKPESRRETWLHATIDREKAIELIKMRGLDDGTFLIRESKKRLGVFVLSMLQDRKTYHFEISKQGIYYFMDQGPYMMSLEHLVDHYSLFPDGLPGRLRIPVGPKCTPEPAPRIPVRRPGSALPKNLKEIDSKKFYENNETLRRVRHSKDDIPREAIEVGPVIGEGEFGSVFEGRYKSSRGETSNIAIKVIHDVTPPQMEDFMREAAVLMRLDHQCVVQMIGISKGAQVMMLLELVPLGSLLDYLLEHQDAINSSMEIPLWAAQIACGCMYLQSQHFVHRDLAARNILLASKFQAKISDFGLSRAVDQQKDYYRASKGGRWPIKWYAPECVNFGTFSHQSDVWSFGVLLWEMYSFGKQPFEGMTGQETVKFIEEGKRLQRPEKAEIHIYNTMTWCWEYKPQARPCFAELFQVFCENPEYENLKELLKSQDLQQLGM